VGKRGGVEGRWAGKTTAPSFGRTNPHSESKPGRPGGATDGLGQLVSKKKRGRDESAHTGVDAWQVAVSRVERKGNGVKPSVGG